MLDLAAQYEQIRAEVEPKLLEVCASQRFILGPEVEAVEAEVAAYVRAQHAVGCASGTDAILLALAAAGVGPGDDVATSAFSFIAGAEAIRLRGARPLFVDIDPGTFNLAADALELAITPKTRAILAVDLFGQCADMQAVHGIGELHGATVIEDAAQSIGAEHRHQRAGEIAHITTFSFYPTKNLGGFGDGGMLTTQSDAIASELRRLRAHGESERYVHARLGTNSRLDELQAAVLRIKLRYLDDWTERRRAHAEDYTRRLLDAGLEDEVRAPKTAVESTRHVFNQYTVRVTQREALRAHLHEHGVGTAVYYPMPLHRQPCFADLWESAPELPHAQRAADEVLALPMYPELSAEQRAYVVECIADFHASR
jgi:dTDP-4-amino-4,6-dideoxygalactose transaminase